VLKNIKQITVKPTINGYALIAKDVDGKTFDCFVKEEAETIFNNDWKVAALMGKALKTQYNCSVVVCLNKKHFPRRIKFK
jgi:hypothetical protein